jgi:hypothetical protein
MATRASWVQGGDLRGARAARQHGRSAHALVALATSGLPVRFEVALGPATLDGSQTELTGDSGIVYVIASQSGNDDWCAAVPVVGSFAVLGGRQPAIYIGATFTGWVPNIEMALEGDAWVAVDVEIPEGEQAFKFANSRDWSDQDWGDAEGFSGTLVPTTGGGPNVRLSVPETGLYRFRFNDITLEYSVQPQVEE